MREAHGGGGLETVVIRPGVIWGPGDPTILPADRRAAAAGADGLHRRRRNLLGLSHVENLQPRASSWPRGARGRRAGSTT